MAAIEAVLFDTVKKVVFSAITKRVNYETERFLTKRKIESRVEDSIAKIIERLIPFFENESITEQKRILLVGTINYELSELMRNPQEFFAGSLDGQKIFECHK